MRNSAEWPVGFVELEASWVWRPLPQAAMFHLTGQDVAEWLQGQVTQNLRQVAEGESTEACLCRATGQLDDIVRLRRLDDSWLVVCERPELFEKRLQEFVIMEDVAGVRFPGQVATVQGPDLPDFPYPFVAADRLGRGGVDLIHDGPLPKPPFSDEAWNLATLEAGEPLLGIDTTDKTLPPELGSAFEDRTISYKKGCYAGQEVLMRIHSRGHTNKTWVGLMSSVEMPRGAEVHRTAEYPLVGWIAAATLRNEMIEAGHVVIDGIEARILPMGRGWATSPASP